MYLISINIVNNMNIFSTWASKTLASFLGVSKEFMIAILPVIKTSVANGLTTALPIAEGVVLSLATDKSTTGAQKRDLAVKQITTALQAQGIQCATSVVNVSVELAVQKLIATPSVSA